MQWFLKVSVLCAVGFSAVPAVGLSIPVPLPAGGQMTAMKAPVAPQTSLNRSLRLVTDTTWRAVGIDPALEGRPIDTVGLAWEAENPGWNADLAYSDADWGFAVRIADSPWVPGALRIWPDGKMQDPTGSTPAYFRKEFTIPGPVTSGQLDLHCDDDCLIYLNGELVWADRNGRADVDYGIDVGSALRSGTNLVAVKAHDSYGVYESIDMAVEVQYAAQNLNVVPEPLTLMGLFAGAVAIGGYVQRRRRIAAAR